MINGNFFIEQQHSGRRYIVVILQEPGNDKLNTLVNYGVECDKEIRRDNITYYILYTESQQSRTWQRCATFGLYRAILTYIVSTWNYTHVTCF